MDYFIILICEAYLLIDLIIKLKKYPVFIKKSQVLKGMLVLWGLYAILNFISISFVNNYNYLNILVVLTIGGLFNYFMGDELYIYNVTDNDAEAIVANYFNSKNIEWVYFMNEFHSNDLILSINSLIFQENKYIDIKKAKDEKLVVNELIHLFKKDLGNKKYCKLQFSCFFSIVFFLCFFIIFILRVIRVF